jgi:hypothetical protein
MTSAWHDIAQGTLDELEMLAEYIAEGSHEGLTTAFECEQLAEAMTRTKLSFVEPGTGDRANWMFGDSGWGGTEKIYFSDRASAGPGVYLSIPILLNESSYRIYATSLGNDDQYMNSFGVFSSGWLSEEELLRNQLVKYEQDRSMFAEDGSEPSLVSTYTGSGFSCAWKLVETDLPATLKDISGAADFVGNIFAQFGMKIAQAFNGNDTKELLTTADDSFLALNYLWESSIELIKEIEFE